MTGGSLLSGFDEVPSPLLVCDPEFLLVSSPSKGSKVDDGVDALAGTSEADPIIQITSYHLDAVSLPSGPGYLEVREVAGGTDQDPHLPWIFRQGLQDVGSHESGGASEEKRHLQGFTPVGLSGNRGVPAWVKAGR
jgi:hypothetical protein